MHIERYQVLDKAKDMSYVRHCTHFTHLNLAPKRLKSLKVSFSIEDRSESSQIVLNDVILIRQLNII